MISKWSIRKYFRNFMIFWSVVSQVWILIQAAKILKSRSAEDISIPSFIILMISTILWLLYGLFGENERNVIMVTSSSVALIFGSILSVSIILYWKPE